MTQSTRQFEESAPGRSEVPLLIGIVGCSSSGKTYSALRLATGMQRVIGSDIYVIDTEHSRAKNYIDFFKFKHIPFDPPFGSLDYLRAIEHCVKKGGKIIVIDSMTHEHSSTGGYLDSANQYIAKRTAGKSPEEAFKIAGKLSRTKWITPAEHRKALTNGIVQMGISGIFCYRASEKLDDDFKPLGWEPETTSKLIYEMQQQFLLLPGSDGVPKFNDATANEKKLIKTPAQFRDWFKQGQRLDEEMGEKMARWASGTVSPASGQSSGTGAVLPSSSGSTAPAKKVSFQEAMSALKVQDQATYYRALGALGYATVEEIPQPQHRKVFDSVRAAVDERAAMAKQ